MRLRWMLIAAATGAAIPLLLLVLVLAGYDIPLEIVFDVLIPLMGIIMLTPHDPLIWEGLYVLIPMFMISNAVIYALAGLLIAQVRLWQRARAVARQPE